MENREIIKKLGLIASLLELHDENPFKVRSYQSVVYHLEKADVEVASLSKSELESLEGIGKSMANTISELNETGHTKLLDQLLEDTPEGLIPLLYINGFGPKKIRLIWQEMGIVDGPSLYNACESGKIAELKGFGEKLQEKLKNALEFTFASQGKFRYRQVENEITELHGVLEKSLPEDKVALAGDFRRNMEIVDTVIFVIGADDIFRVHQMLDNLDLIEKDNAMSGPFTWRGRLKSVSINLEMHIAFRDDFTNSLIKHTGSEQHLSANPNGKKNLFELLAEKKYENEAQFYEAAGMSWVPPELREGSFEIEMAKSNDMPTLLELGELKGVLHNHSTFSDGQHTLREMAERCIQLGYEYFGICDHSKTAIYANGLDEDRVRQQHQEIDVLNEELKPFRIFKGIESDILNDGSLDYDPQILASFDFIVASVHSQLTMDINKATSRLLTAIANPYTTMLGHPTGRLLLKRAGYPINHRAVIDACAKNNVIIEINAHPFRLDLDWRWVHYAIESGVMLSINPDAHSMDQIELMKYGVLVGRKGGLTKSQTFNCKNVDEVVTYFVERKEKITSKIN